MSKYFIKTKAYYNGAEHPEKTETIFCNSDTLALIKYNDKLLLKRKSINSFQLISGELVSDTGKVLFSEHYTERKCFGI